MTTGVNTASQSSASTQSAAMQQLSGNLDTFLQLLTTQLQNQDPLNPMDSNEFTQQLVEYSQVEQQINTNSNLQNLISLTQSNAGTAAVGYLNQTVTVTNGNAALNDGSADWTYTLGSASNATQLTVTNSSGQVVYTTTGSTDAGANSFEWDGEDNNGNDQPAGTYTLTVTATGANGASIPATVSSSGVVSEITFQNGQPMLMIGGMAVPLSQVSAISPTT